MKFLPTFCPHSDCPSHEGGRFRFQRKGHYQRKCDGRRIPRFRCLCCGRQFSSQTFRFTYRYRKPTLRLQLFHLLSAKVTMRQAARILGCSRTTVERLNRRMGRVCKDFHRLQLERNRHRLDGSFQLDELETFETDRLVQPVTVPVLIEKTTYFVIHAETAPMASRGRMNGAAQRRKEAYERRHGKRTSGSRQAVERTMRELEALLPLHRELNIQTDRKTSYRRLVHEIFPGRIGSHVRESSRRRRDYSNVLFPINHTLAMMRDGISRLVRRSWGASKDRRRLEDHMAIWMAYRNYVRGVTVKASETTPAMAIGVLDRRLGPREILAWRWPKRMDSCPPK